MDSNLFFAVDRSAWLCLRSRSSPPAAEALQEVSILLAAMSDGISIYMIGAGCAGFTCAELDTARHRPGKKRSRKDS